MILEETILLDNMKVTNSDGTVVSLYTFIYENCFKSFISNGMFASLIFSIIHVLTYITFAFILDKKNIYIKL